MITLKLKYNDQTRESVVTPTFFPDGTSQVYKVESLDNTYSQVLEAQILWQYENEAELVHVAQLSDLIDSYKGHVKPFKVLNVPFLPYGRQDKPVINSMTFGQYSFGNIINILKFDKVISFDPHGNTNIEKFHRISANPTILKLFQDEKYDVLAFPDGGACQRYNPDETVPSVNGVRTIDRTDPTNTSYHLVTDGVELSGKRILVVDDILDQGGTFIKLALLLKEHKPAEISVYTSHFTGGLDTREKLINAGYTNFYTTNSLIKNSDGIKIV